MTRTYGSGSTATAALRGVTFTVGEGKLVALLGRSGSGKTTLLNIVGGLDTPDGGSISIAGHSLTAMGERERMRHVEAEFSRWLCLLHARDHEGIMEAQF